MKVATEKRRSPIVDNQISLEEYLAYDDGTGIVYELVKGELVAMSVGTGRHGAIAEFVNAEFKDEIKRSSLAWTSKDMKIGVQSPRGNRWDTCRIPDVAVILMEQWEKMQDREAVIYLNSPQPLLVVEVVSPSTIQEDYRAKHSEYSLASRIIRGGATVMFSVIPLYRKPKNSQTTCFIWKHSNLIRLRSEFSK